MNGEETPQTLHALLDVVAARYGEVMAVQWAGGSVSYRQMGEESAALARGLLAAGVGKGSRVAVLAGNTWFWIRAFFACAQVGAVVAPVSTLATPHELAHVLRHSDAQLLLAARRYVGRDYGQTIARALPALAQAHYRRALRLTEAPYLRSIWLDEAEGLPWAGAVEGLVTDGAADTALDAAFLEEIKAEVTPADDAVIIYTSGSTALPKAVIHTHGPMVRQVVGHLADAQVGKPGERVLSVMPLFWVGGMTMMLNTFVKGGCIVLPQGVSPRSIADALRDLGADVCHGWLPQRKAIRDFLDAEGWDYSHVRGLRDERLADGSLRPRDLAPNSLGMTETFGPHGIMPVGAMLPAHRAGAFAPADGGFERRVVDPESGEVLPAGQTGELQVRGGSLMRGFYKRERADAFTPDGFYPTSDIVRIEPDGYMYFTGRLGDMLKTKGANVSRLEVEDALRKIPGVAEAVVCGLPDPELGQLVVAAVVPKPGETPTEAGLKAALSEYLAGYKIPGHIVFIDQGELPWTASGKIRVPEVGKLIASRLGLPA